MASAFEPSSLKRALLAGGLGEREDGAPQRADGRRLAVGLRPMMAALLLAGMLFVPAFTAAAAESSPLTGAAVRDIPGCGEEQRATWTDGSSAPWQACNSRTAIVGIEGSIAVNNRGAVFMAAALRDKNDHAGLARSRDGGKSWQRVTLPIEVQEIIGYVQVDRATNRLFFTSIARMLPAGGPGFGTTNPIGYSDDDGETWHVSRISGAANGEPDSMGDIGTIFVGPPPAGRKTSGYPNVVYTCNMSPRPTVGPDAQCWRSLDGGKSFRRPSAQTTFDKKNCAPVRAPDGLKVFDNVFTGRGIAGPDGTVYLPMSMCGQFVVGTSRDAGESFTWAPIPSAFSGSRQNIIADENKNVPGCRQSLAFAGCPEIYQNYGQERLARDTNGTLYFIFNQHRLMLSMSKDGGKSWTEPMALSAPGVQTVFSSVAAQGPGRVGLSYLGRSEGSQDWHGYMAVVENADDPSARKIATARVSAPENPLMPYRCCGSPKRKTANPALLTLKEGALEAIMYNYNLIEHGGLSFAPDGTLWATFFRDSTRDPNNFESADYEIVAGHMTPVGAFRR